MKPVVGYIGLGDIGAPMAGRIIPGGYELVVWNRTAEKMRPFVEAGAKAATSAADLAARCDIVCFCVDSVEAAKEIMFGEAGVIHGGRARLIVDHCTFHPETARALAARAEDAGLRYLDAPISGGSNGARMGTLAIMVGGHAGDVETARPILMTYANRVTHMGGHGTGMATKLCNQILSFGTMLAVAEMYSLGARDGIDLNALPEALRGGLTDSTIFSEYVRATRAGEDDNVAGLINRIIRLYSGQIDPADKGTMVVAVKDSGIVAEIGRHVGSPTPVTALFNMFATMIHHPVPARP